MKDRDGYGVISRINHWIVAGAMVGVLGLGPYLEFAGLDRDARGLLLFIHRSLGVTILVFGAWRVFWRLLQGFPDAASGIPKWQEQTAKLVHGALLAGILIMPVSGVAFTVFRGRDVDVFGWFSIPAQSDIQWIVRTASIIHTYFGYALAILILLHAAAALTHHFFQKDNTLRRMTSGA